MGLEKAEPVHLERTTQFMHGERPLSVGGAGGHKPAVQLSARQGDEVDLVAKR